MRVRGWVVVLALAVVATGCGGVKRRDGADRPVQTVSVGQGLLGSPDAAEASDAGAAAAGLGTLELQITDDNELHPSRIPVTLTGPDGATTIVSDANGMVRHKAKPGIYSAKVLEGCHEAVLVHDGGSAKLGLVAGQTLKGTLQVIWQSRFGPSAPVFADIDGDWPIGRKVRLTYVVRDHCTDEPAKTGKYPTFVFDHSKNLTLVGTPVLTGDEDGRARISAQCTAKGDMSLVARDTSNPDEQIDMIALAIGYNGVPRCA